jgi:hypothetical protein
VLITTSQINIRGILTSLDGSDVSRLPAEAVQQQNPEPILLKVGIIGEELLP